MWCWQFGISDLAIRSWQEVTKWAWQLGKLDVMNKWEGCGVGEHAMNFATYRSKSLGCHYHWNSLHLFPQYASMNFHFIGWGLTLRNSIHSNPFDGFTLVAEWTFMYMNGESGCAKVGSSNPFTSPLNTFLHQVMKRRYQNHPCPELYH
jgi:hypothetical protein